MTEQKDQKKTATLIDTAIRRAPLFFVIILVAALIWPIAQRQGSTLLRENVSPDGAYKVQVYRYANPFTADPEGGSGWVELHDVGGDVWDVLGLDDVKNLQITWNSENVVFGPEAFIPLPTAKELAKQAEEKARDAAAAAEEAAALAQQKAESEARAKARAEAKAQQ